MKEILSKKEYHASLPTKCVGCAVLFFDEDNKLLIVKPSYKNDWQVPGGTVDQGESPRETAIRETQEEIGITCDDPRFLLVEYKAQESEKPDFIEFVFYGGVITESEKEQIKIDGEEIVDYRFVEVEEALGILRRSLKRRVPLALKVLENGIPEYFEFKA